MSDKLAQWSGDITIGSKMPARMCGKEAIVVAILEDSFNAFTLGVRSTALQEQARVLRCTLHRTIASNGGLKRVMRLYRKLKSEINLYNVTVKVSKIAMLAIDQQKDVRINCNDGTSFLVLEPHIKDGALITFMVNYDDRPVKEKSIEELLSATLCAGFSKRSWDAGGYSETTRELCYATLLRGGLKYDTAITKRINDVII